MPNISPPGKNKEFFFLQGGGGLILGKFGYLEKSHHIGLDIVLSSSALEYFKVKHKT